tara:strand:- start:1041 stop:1475 length:435 start_codon:yes stop_codon:yes gene_type:complete
MGRQELMRKQKLAREAKKNALKTKTSTSKPTTAAAQRKLNRASQSEKFAKRAEEQKKVQAERQKARESASAIDRKRNARRGTGVKNRTDNPIGGNIGEKKVTKSKGKGGGVTINGKPPTSIQKKLLAGGWSAKELEAKINRKKK